MGSAKERKSSLGRHSPVVGTGAAARAGRPRRDRFCFTSRPETQKASRPSEKGEPLGRRVAARQLAIEGLGTHLQPMITRRFVQPALKGAKGAYAVGKM